jgi:O-antigen/teichoic acid export membrane protein
VASGAAWLLFGRLTVFGLNVVYAIVAARWLGRDAFGVAAAIWAIVLLCTAFQEETLSLGVSREVARRPADASEVIANGWALATLVGLISALAMPSVAALLGYPAELMPLIWIAALMSALRSPKLALNGAFNALGRPRTTAKLGLLSGGLSVAVGLPTLLLGGGVAGIFACTAFSHLVGLIVAVLIARRALPPSGLGHVGGARLAALGRAISGFGARAVLGVLLFRVDGLVIPLLASFGTLGLYRVAQRVLDVAVIPTFAVNQALMPTSTRMHTSDAARLQTLFARHVTYVAAATLPVCAAIVLYRDFLTWLVFGPEYAESAPIVGVMGAIVFLLFLRGAIVNIVASSSRQRPATIIALAEVGVNIALLIALVPRWGGMGAAAALGVALMLGMVASWALVRTIMSTRVALLGLARVVGVGLPLAIAAWVLQGLHPLASAIVIPVYAVLLHVQGIPTDRDRRRGLELLRDVPLPWRAGRVGITQGS